MSVDSNGKESFFATVEKSQDLQKKRIEKKAAEKKEQKVREHRKAEKQARQDRIDKAKEKKAEKDGKTDNDEIPSEIEKRIHDKVVEVYGKEYVTIEADSAEDLLSKVQSYSYDAAAGRVMTASERMVGGHVDFRG